MDKLILYPTDTSQWYALVHEAQAESQIILCENVESYLVFLLMRFSGSAKLMDSVIALEFLDSMHVRGQTQIRKLRDVGDKSLLFSGLFPGVAKKRGLSVDYFIHLGQSAYLSVGELEESENDLFTVLSEQFINMKNILETMQVHVYPNL